MSRSADRCPLSAILFDFDGTLMDTESTVLAAWEAEYAHHGQVLERAEWLTAVGTGGLDWYTRLAALVGPDFDREAAQSRRRAREAELVADLGLRAGIVECLDDARARGLKLAVVSSSPRDWVVGHLARLGLLPRFDAVLTREDGARGKPHPDLYLAALSRLELAPSGVVAVEDSANGVAAAVAAGLRVAAVPNAVTCAQVLSEATVVLDPVQLRTWIESLVEKSHTTEKGSAPSRRGAVRLQTRKDVCR